MTDRCRETGIKLTNRDMRTHGGCQWVLGEWREASGEGGLCGPGWLHYYPFGVDLAIAMDPIHARFGPCHRAFRVEVEGRQIVEPLKAGSTRLRLVEEVPIPVISLAARVRWTIYVFRAIQGRRPIPAWEAWADGWLSGARRERRRRRRRRGRSPLSR